MDFNKSDVAVKELILESHCTAATIVLAHSSYICTVATLEIQKDNGTTQQVMVNLSDTEFVPASFSQAIFKQHNCVAHQQDGPGFPIMGAALTTELLDGSEFQGNK